jgi:hypothetical protein
MKGFLIFVLGAVIGAVAGVFVLAPIVLGVGAGVGIATGLKAGACLTIEGVKEAGLITDEQVDEVLQAAMAQISSEALPAGSADAEGGLDCDQMIADMRAAATQQ